MTPEDKRFFAEMDILEHHSSFLLRSNVFSLKTVKVESMRKLVVTVSKLLQYTATRFFFSLFHLILCVADHFFLKSKMSRKI